jgi:hypothetical protein
MTALSHVCTNAPEGPNATLQAPPSAGARHERTLVAVACKRLFGTEGRWGFS